MKDYPTGARGITSLLKNKEASGEEEAALTRFLSWQGCLIRGEGKKRFVASLTKERLMTGCGEKGCGRGCGMKE